MKKICTFILFFACLQAFALPHYELAYRLTGGASMMMPDGKVEEWTGKRPLLGGSFDVEFLPTGRWHCLQQWNNASIGVGATYINLGNDDKLGSSFSAYAYINEPFYNGRHFRIGIRPTVGLAAVTRTAVTAGITVEMSFFFPIVSEPVNTPAVTPSSAKNTPMRTADTGLTVSSPVR